MDGFVEGLQAAPPWAQAIMALFALTVVVMLVEPAVRRRRARQRFDALAAARQARVVPGHDTFTASFEVEVSGRRVTVRRELRGSTRGSSYRGPRGHLTVIETPLAGSRWAMHGIDIAERGALARLGLAPTRSGDAAFDARFTLWQDGVPVRDGWLDAPTRQAFVALFDLPTLGTSGTVWVTEGRLQCIHDAPATLDATLLNAVLETHAALASALERTAGWRGPAA